MTAEQLLDKINKLYENGFHAVKDLSIDVADGEFLVLVGPSGCGKSTALRMVAGLEDISTGELRIGERRVNDVERYEFRHGADTVVLILSGPKGADNVDPWRIVTDSLRWR